MQLIRKFNKVIRFLLCVIHIYSKYAWVILLKVKRGITISNAFQKILDESNRREVSLKDLNQIIYGLIKAMNFMIDQ